MHKVQCFIVTPKNVSLKLLENERRALGDVKFL